MSVRGADARAGKNAGKRTQKGAKKHAEKGVKKCAEKYAEKYIEKRITVINKLGLHARAAAKLVKLAAGFQSAIQLRMNGGAEGKTADARSIMGVMMLAATQGSELTLTVRGEDAERAARAVSRLFADCFGEGE